MNDQLTDPIEGARRSYAEELRFTAHIRSPAVVTAFAAVPRERFVGAGPWRVRSSMDMAEYWTTEDGDPRAVYHDVLIALDEKRQINNGQPSLWAFLLDQLDVAAGEQALHLGCGTGYYTAVVAELVGPTGKVTAIEIDAGLAEKARAALKPWPQITVSNADGATLSFEPADLIAASAGATHPLSSWLVDGIALGIAGRHRSHVPANCGLQPTRLVDWTLGQYFQMTRVGRKRNGCVRAIAAGNRKSQRECDCPQSTSEGSPLSQSASVPRSPQVPNAPPEFRVRDPRLERPPDLQFNSRPGATHHTMPVALWRILSQALA